MVDLVRTCVASCVASCVGLGWVAVRGVSLALGYGLIMG